MLVSDLTDGDPFDPEVLNAALGTAAGSVLEPVQICQPVLCLDRNY
jgi:hypothetical protein